MYLDYYLKELNYQHIPDFLTKYLKCPSLLRLKKVGYFCGMDYASKNIYNFREYITRYDHSLTVSLLIYKITNDKKQTLAGLFHDISTPCFSHVIDYMNNDFINQESTEEYTELIIKKDKYLLKCLKEDHISIDDIINFKKYPLVDNSRPNLCADRLDGIILTAISWTKNITKKDIKNIIDDITIYKNENNVDEIGFKSLSIANKILNINNKINKYCHSKEDNYMMLLLASVTRLAISKEYITYDNLYTYSEEELLKKLDNIDDSELSKKLNIFKNITKEDIPNKEYPNIKDRNINPLVNGKRLKNMV